MRVDRQAVLEAATWLLGANPGASMQEIAAAAAISRASLHRLFPTRADLIAGIGDLAVERVTAAVAAACLDDGPALDALQRVAQELEPVVHQFWFLAIDAQLHESEDVRKADRQVHEALLGLFQRGQEEGVLRADLPTGWLLRAYGWLLYAAVTAARRGEIAPRDTARLVLSTFITGTAAPSGRRNP